MKNVNTWVGLDVHAKTIFVAILRASEEAPREQFELPHDFDGVRKLVRRLKTLPGTARCIYEAGPCGFPLQRHLASKGIACDIAAPALIPRKPGDRVKTDRRDAIKLARLHRAGEITVIPIPTERDEAIRDLVRAREDAKEDVLRHRHHLSKFLLRHDLRFHGKSWSNAHSNWLRQLRVEDPNLQAVLDEYRIALDLAVERRRRLEKVIADAAQAPERRKRVDGYRVFRGIDTLSAMTIAAEAWNIRAYPRARQFMAAIGAVPSEYSSGERECRGAITKSGNAHLRRVLVEAAWQYSYPFKISRAIHGRREGQPAELVALAQRADVRLHRKFQRLVRRGKRSTVAAVAVARELAGFVWAAGRLL